MYHSLTGVISKEGGQAYVTTERGERGCAIFGPYVSLSPGSYEVAFHLHAKGWPGSTCCTVDVVADGRDVLARRELTCREISQSQGKIALSFEVDEPRKFEFRVIVTGRAAIRALYHRPVRLLNRDQSAQPERTLAIYETHRAWFSSWRDRGFLFEIPDPNGGQEVLAHYRGLSFLIRNEQDMLLAGEIFLLNQYTFDLKSRAVVIDIGMNIGLASLMFAMMPNVDRVFAFEPFAAPFARAERNFALNPSIDTKISRYRVGLSDEDKTLSVAAQQEDTIGVSIRGNVNGGAQETIEVHSAARRLSPIFEDARTAGQAIILKVDCEGSEFAVFDDLNKAGLLGEVTAIACEWHKWWSPGLTHAAIVDPLREQGFVIVDRTDPSDRNAGQFIAIRSALRGVR